jgi:dienelactone hydrolase
MRLLRWPFLASALLWPLVDAALVRGDMIIFKDGLIMQGNVRQQGSLSTDPESGLPFWMPKGSFILDQDSRRVFFSHVQLQDVQKHDDTEGGEPIKLESRIGRYNALPMYDLIHLMGATEWNDKWERNFKLEAPFGRLTVKQRLGLMTPQYMRVDALKYYWSAFYQTREFSPQVICALLANHPDLKLDGKEQDLTKAYRMYRFLAQAGLYNEAEDQLNTIVKKWPAEKEKAEESRATLARLRTLRVYEEIQQAHKAGRHRWVQEQLTQFPRKGVDEKLTAGIRSLKVNYETMNEKLESARRLLDDLPNRTPVAQRPQFREAAKAILEELTYENVNRLEAFIPLALQAERDRKRNKKPAQEPGQLLALALSGWLLGKDSAEANAYLALRLWRARQFVQQYQRTVEEDDRKVLRQKYERGEPVGIDELERIISFLPPAEPEKEVGTEPVSLRTNLPWGPREGTPYLVQLPPEYHPGRLYPVVLALHAPEEKSRMMIERLGAEAARRGYILAAPEWQQLLEGGYNYTPEEHAAVLDVLRDLRRRFRVDSDRVFITGVSDGANMAFDVGLAHPDQFAGVVPVSGQPQFYSERYSANGQLLPFLVIAGDKAGTVPKLNQDLFRKWVPLGYPAIYIAYKGRGLEWFEAEVPTMFEWMDHKKDRHKRATGVPELGKQGGSIRQEFQTLRPTDNRFYWLSTESIRSDHLIDPKHWKGGTWGATLQGRVAEGNNINVNVSNLKQLTVWLAKDMIDFNKEATIRVNGRTMWVNRKIPPSVDTLLEDFYVRGDNQRLFWAKLDFDRL